MSILEKETSGQHILRPLLLRLNVLRDHLDLRSIRDGDGGEGGGGKYLRVTRPSIKVVSAKQLVYLATCSFNSCGEHSHKDSACPENQLLKPEANYFPVYYESNVVETSERRGGAYMGFSERIDTILN